MKRNASLPDMERVGTSPNGEPDEWSKLKRKWAVYSPGELEQRCEELGSEGHCIEGLFPDRSLGLVLGDSGRGKSPLLYQACLCVAAGVPFLGHAVRQGRVLYLDYENGLGQVRELIIRLTQHLGFSERPEDLLLWNMNDCSQEIPPTFPNAVEMIREMNPSLAIIDSIGSCYPEIEDKNSITSRAYRELRKLIRDCGTTIICVHHLRKPSSKPEHAPASLQDDDWNRWFLQARGARALINGSDVRLGVDEYDGLATGTGETSEEIALVWRGFARIRGEIPLTHLARVLDEDGEPLGYRRVSGVSLLGNHEQAAAYHSLPEEFRFKEAQQTYCKGAQAITDFLKKCMGLGVLRKFAGGYQKVKLPE